LAKENLVGKYVNDETATSMAVSKKSIDDALAHGSGPVKIQAIAATPRLITGLFAILGHGQRTTFTPRAERSRVELC
jgi:hypothetical protein